jgi:membrane peptidoglycan carboxypeptidase
LRRAVIATEDARFYDHSGLGLRAIGRAGLDAALHLRLRSGASTITQQLARNLYLKPAERSSGSPFRKLKEASLALRLE